MAHFQFDVLSDKEFEALSIDLLSEFLKTRIQRFKAGKDGGVDGRFYKDDGETIIQCKQCGTNISQLKTVLKKELKSLAELKPKRYIVVTSLKLSKKNKTDILGIFKGFNLVEEDIFGNEDLTDLLNKNPLVLNRHFKLWLTSKSVLDIVFNNDISGRSKFKLEETRENLKYYVQTVNHDNSIQKIEKTNCLIVTGIPGIGKSTLAENVCLYYVGQEFEFIQIHDSIEEGERFFISEKKQIFYFDDFLGRTHLYQIQNNADQKTVNFIRRVIKDPTKRFVLTSRTNILSQGKALSDLFDINNISRNEFEIRITSLTSLDKAKILYNHIVFGNLPKDFVDKFYENENYLKIINHRNFNPRLIQFITDYTRFEEIGKEFYWPKLYEIIEKPKQIWKQVFESQLDEVSRHIVIGLAIYGRGMNEEDFFNFIDEIFESFPNNNSSITIDSCLKVLIDSLITRNINFFNQIDYNLYNPSIADFVNDYYISKTKYIADLMICSNSLQMVQNIKSLFYSKKISRKNYKDLVITVLNRQLAKDNKCELNSFMMSLIMILDDNEKGKVSNIYSFLDEKINHWLGDEDFSLGIEEIEFLNDISSNDKFEGVINNFSSKLLDTIENEDFDNDEWEIIGSSVYFMDSEEVRKAHHERYLEHCKATITQQLIDNSVLVDFDVHEDEDVAFDKVKSYLKDYSAYLDFNDIEFEEICENIDLYKIYDYNIEMITEHEEPRMKSKSNNDFVNEDDAIHDLFDRE